MTQPPGAAPQPVRALFPSPARLGPRGILFTLLADAADSLVGVGHLPVVGVVVRRDGFIDYVAAILAAYRAAEPDDLAAAPCPDLVLPYTPFDSDRMYEQLAARLCAEPAGPDREDAAVRHLVAAIDRQWLDAVTVTLDVLRTVDGGPAR